MIDKQYVLMGTAAGATALAPFLVHMIAPAATPFAAFLASAGTLAVGWQMAVKRPAPKVSDKPATDWAGLVRRLAIILSARDQGVNGHVFNVEHYALALADRLQVSAADREAIAIAAILHDIGKLGLPDRILLQDGPLPPAEREVVKTHAAYGAAMLAGIDIPESVLHIIRHHHENWDGSGYPDRLAGQHIPLAARIVSVADVYDALTTARAYRGAWTQQRSLEHIQAQSGKQFDPYVVEALSAVLAEKAEAAKSAPAGASPQPITSLELPVATMSSLHAVYAAGLESSLLYELDRILGGEMSTNEMLSSAAQTMQRCLSSPMCAIVTRDPESDTLRPHWPAGSDGFPFWLRELLAVSKRVIDTHESWHGSWTLQGRADGMVLPIEREGEVLGALAIVRGNVVTQDLQLELSLQHVAARIATALDSSLLFDRARHHAFVDPMTGLYNIRYFKNFLDQICETARLAASGWTSASAEPSAASFLAGQVAPVGPYDSIGIPVDTEMPGENGTGERRISSKKLAEQPLTRRLVRREQSDGAPARISSPRGMNVPASGDVSCFTLLCLDLNNFKPVNDRFGHLEGDRVLRDIADRLRQTAPAGAVVARYGGDEFLIALPGYDAADTAKVVSYIHHGVESYNCGLPDKNGSTLRISVSIGMSVFPSDGMESATLLSIADQRMFRAKTSRKAAHGETARVA